MKRNDKNVGKLRVQDVEVAAPAPEQENDPSRGIQERALLVRTATAFWHGTNTDHVITKEICDAKDVRGVGGRFVKIAMDPGVLKKLYKIIRDWRKYEREHSLPWGDDNRRLLSIESFFAYKKQAAVAAREFDLAVDELVREYPKAVAKQRERLQKMWRAEDYPSVHELRDCYSLRMFVEPIPTGDDFRVKLSKNEAEEIRQAYDAEIKARLKDAVRNVFDQMNELVTALRDKLADSDASLRKGSFEALRKLVDVLPQLNAAVQDPHIRELGNQIARDLLALDAAEVNDDQGMRNTAKSKADKLLAALKPLRANWLNTGETDANEDSSIG